MSHIYIEVCIDKESLMKTFFKGALLLVIAAFLSECLEFVINMVLARELGDEALGRYMSILPTIILIVVLASIELPISISKFIAEQDKKYHLNMLQHTLRFTLLFTIIFVLLVTVVLPFIPVFDRYHPMIRWLIILLIPIISLSSVARGYFMGSHRMGKIALSNFLRRAAQLILLVILFQWFNFEHDLAILIAICTLIGSELIVFLYLITAYFLQLNSLKKEPSENISGKTVRQQLLAVSIPTTGVRIFHAVTFAIKPFLIKAALLNSGLTEAVAMAQYGKLAGVAFTIGFFPAFIAHSLLIVLIPTVSEAYAKRDFIKLQTLLQKVMLFTFFYGLVAVTIFYVYAEPLTTLFFESSRAAGYLQLLCLYFLFHYFVMPMQAYLIGLGLVKDAFLHAVWATIISFALMYFLGSMEQLQMDGVIIGMNAGVVLLTLMHYVTICNKIGSTLLLRAPSHFKY